jgi:nitroreductase
MNKLYDTKLSDFEQRYGGELPDNTFPTNEFIENIIKRKTVRNFTDQKIDPALLEKLFAAAQSSPTSSMFQTWSAIVIEDKQHRENVFFGNERNRGLMGLNDRHVIKNGKRVNMGPADNVNYISVMGCNLFIVWCVDLYRIDQVLADPEIRVAYPTDTIDLSHEAFRYANYEIRSMCDAIIAAQTFCLSAESVGLGTQYCGSIKCIDLSESLNLPKRVLPLFGICLGYPKENLDFLGVVNSKTKPEYLKPRLTQQAVVHREQYQITDINVIKKYNLIMRKFYHYYGMFKADDWIERIIVRTQLNPPQKLYRVLLNKYDFWFK